MLESSGVDDAEPDAQPRCRTSSCPPITTSAPKTSSPAACTATLAAAADARPCGFLRAAAVPGVGARTVRALAMVAEVVHGAPYRFTDPARFSLAHGGKDRHPYPVPLKVYDRTINVLKTAVQRAKLGRSEELAALKRLDEQAADWKKAQPDLRSKRCSPRSAINRTAMVVEAFLAPRSQLMKQRRLRNGVPRENYPYLCYR